MNERPFYDVIRESDIRFGFGDLMDVELEERQMLNESTDSYETRSIWVNKVHRYIPRDEQGELPLAEKKRASERRPAVTSASLIYGLH